MACWLPKYSLLVGKVVSCQSSLLEVERGRRGERRGGGKEKGMLPAAAPFSVIYT